MRALTKVRERETLLELHRVLDVSGVDCAECQPVAHCECQVRRGASGDEVQTVQAVDLAGSAIRLTPPDARTRQTLSKELVENVDEYVLAVDGGEKFLLVIEGDAVAVESSSQTVRSACRTNLDSLRGDPLVGA